MLYLATALSLFLLSLLTPHTRGIVYRSNTQVNMEEVLNRLEETEKPVVVGLIINNNSGHAKCGDTGKKLGSGSVTLERDVIVFPNTKVVHDPLDGRPQS